ncbi:MULTISPECIES: arginase [unclassified Sedimentibacter]|uniref:arginase n=1 Tax=unclassified Sedimentibacter TaxID=2649220 RepID=UPI0027DF7DE7|nr:arginase [Sedimentibacter sp. MB35-C1]WMJ77643.1 arginase [Sedimentibacter sp. MB35-C1]
MKFNLISVPINYGCDREGAQFGPETFKKNGIVELIKEEGHDVCDKGDIEIPFASPEEKYSGSSKLKYLNPIAEYNNNLAEAVYSSISEGAIPFIVGGDHSLGMGSIAGTSKYFKEIAVIWVDAHGDINTEDTSPSGNIHGMPLAASMNFGNPALTNIYYNGQKVKPENVYILGARDIDPGEYELAKKSKLNLYTMDDVRKNGLDNTLKEITNKIKNSGVDAVHLSFDIDALDKSLVPGTGTAVSEGFSLEEGENIFAQLIGGVHIASMDFVELNPLIDDEDKKTVKNCFKLLKNIFRLFKNQEEKSVEYAI